jgi:transcriptional regulator with XRE-family HTH domain
MTTALRFSRVPLRDQQTLSYGDLHREANEAFAGAGLSQTELALRLGVTQSAVSHALGNAGRRWANLQLRIINELVRDFEVEDEPLYRVRKR